MGAMVKIAIIGWYGTETLGDRAILAGLFSLFKKAYGSFEIHLGSLYPFFTERTLWEDQDFLCQCAQNPSQCILLFDSQIRKSLDAAIRSCDMLVMGGGPLMGMACMFMVEYAFARAKKLGKRTLILGCGVGPMRKKLYERSLVNIIGKSDVTIFRDDTSKQEYERILGRKSVCESAIDPAVFAALEYKEHIRNEVIQNRDNSIVACIRAFPEEYKISNNIITENINKYLVHFMNHLQRESGKDLLLLPMHYFGIGGDDRVFMNKISFDNKNIAVQNDPLSLTQTMTRIAESSICAGMRFHSVVLQTILNGNNIVLDYTDPATGKIGNFLRQIGAMEHYAEGYVVLQQSERVLPKLNKTVFEVKTSRIQLFLDTYMNELCEQVGVNR
jgi:polysaccharide pyruvyl transferase WcaK-like protein